MQWGVLRCPVRAVIVRVDTIRFEWERPVLSVDPMAKLVELGVAMEPKVG